MAEPAPSRAQYRVVDGTEFYLTIRPAEAIRAQYPPGSKERAMHGGVPEGTDYYHVEVRLFNGHSRTAIKNAQVELTVAEQVPSGEKKKLEPVEVNEMSSYGNYFRMPGKDPYTITVSARNPSSPRPIEATFHYKRD